jgi:tRNA(Ile)-lysidine synthase
MAVLDFLRRCHHVQVIHVNHGTSHATQAEQFVTAWCAQHGIPVQVHAVTQVKPKTESWEEFWRNERYHIFHQLDACVVTAHHLDDAVETYLFNCLHGKSHTMPAHNRNVIRPFLCTPKSALLSWCDRKQVPHVTDPSNTDLRYMRNLIRDQIVPLALRVNPGLRKVVRKIIQDDFS